MSKSTLGDDLKGLNQLTHEGFIGATDVAESLHQSILSFGGLLNNNSKTGGLTGLIYRSVRFVAKRSFQGTDWAINSLSPLLPTWSSGRQRQRWLSMLNGVLGDHLVVSDNPLAVTMTMVDQQQAITPQEAAKYWTDAGKRLVLMVHGLCLSESCWQAPGRHGESLASLGHHAPLYLRYNSGLSIAENGRQLSAMLDLISEYLPVEHSFDFLTHSMGGLVVRSALHAAQEMQHDWPRRVVNMVFLGTPHHGALLEKTGYIAHYLMTISPYSRPFAKIANRRSQGIQDLNTGRISDDGHVSEIPAHIKSYAIAAKLSQNQQNFAEHWLGDGLVSVASALGHHQNKTRHLNIEKNHQWVVSNVSHMGLLSDPVVLKHILSVLNG